MRAGRAVRHGGRCARRYCAETRLRAALFGSLWVALPCGLLQSALLVAALASTPVSGAAVMAAFALTSSLSLWAGPALWFRWAGRDSAARWQGSAIRVAGSETFDHKNKEQRSDVRFLNRAIPKL